MPELASESELVDRAVREAVELVEQGDLVRVAVAYAVEERGIEHRQMDVHERVQEAIDDAE